MRNFLFIAVFFGLFLACSKEKTEPSAMESDEPVYMQGEAYGSTYSIIYYGNGKNYNQDIEEILKRFDQSVNTYRKDSYLSAFNNSEQGSAADATLLEMVDLSKDLNILSNGYFDPSVEPLSVLWGFSKNRLKNRPSPRQIDSVMQFVGLQHVKSLKDSLLKDDARFKLSFNSITGYVNDKVAEFLADKKVDNYLIEIGGEVYAHGYKQDSIAWKVGIDDPIENGRREVNTIVNLYNQGLATSGNYRKFILDEKTGEKIVHTINPKTGAASPSKLLSATVIAQTTAEADAMATAVMAMGYDMALDFMKAHPELQFYLIWNNTAGKLEHKGFNGFEYSYKTE